jgi:hypothetical protein
LIQYTTVFSYGGFFNELKGKLSRWERHEKLKDHQQEQLCLIRNNLKMNEVIVQGEEEIVRQS